MVMLPFHRHISVWQCDHWCQWNPDTQNSRHNSTCCAHTEYDCQNPEVQTSCTINFVVSYTNHGVCDWQNLHLLYDQTHDLANHI